MKLRRIAIFSLILTSARRIVELAEYVKAGKWTRSIEESMYGINVHGKTIGMLGMGRIGSAVARRAHHGFGMRVIYHNTRPNPRGRARTECHIRQSRRLARASRLCLPDVAADGADRTTDRCSRICLDEAECVFINGSRGRIVDEAALIQALQNKTIYGAGLDVFEKEPLPVDSPLLQLSNVVALPHIGSATHETRLAMATLAVDNLVAGLRGETPRHLAN